jgi:FixJ family two-component response regulator
MINCAHTVCVVDDEPAMLRALARLLESGGFRVQTFASASAFLEFTEAELPCCVLLDINLPEMNGLQIQAELLDSEIDCPIVFLSGQADISMSVEAMKAGAIDFLTKPVDAEALIDAVNAALHRHAIGIEQRDTLASLADRWNSLTPREREVSRLVVAGQLNKEIAASLGTAEKTIKVHRGRAMRKMQARRVADLVRMAGQLNEPTTAPAAHVEQDLAKILTRM